VDQLPGDGQFSIKTQGIGAAASEAERQQALAETISDYEHKGFVLAEEVLENEQPAAFVVKRRPFLGNTKYKIIVDEYGSVLVEESEAGEA